MELNWTLTKLLKQKRSLKYCELKKNRLKFLRTKCRLPVASCSKRYNRQRPQGRGVPKQVKTRRDCTLNHYTGLYLSSFFRLLHILFCKCNCKTLRYLYSWHSRDSCFQMNTRQCLEPNERNKWIFKQSTTTRSVCAKTSPD